MCIHHPADTLSSGIYRRFISLNKESGIYIPHAHIPYSFGISVTCGQEWKAIPTLHLVAVCSLCHHGNGVHIGCIIFACAREYRGFESENCIDKDIH